MNLKLIFFQIFLRNFKFLLVLLYYDQNSEVNYSDVFMKVMF